MKKKPGYNPQPMPTIIPIHCDCEEDIRLDNIYRPVINPVPTHHFHHHPPCPPKPPIDDGEKYVTKRQFNEVIQNIANALIFEDKSLSGTSISSGGIKKGTKFCKLTFTEFVQLLLFPEDVEDGDEYITRSELKETLSKVAFSGKYSDLIDIPTNFDYEYPCKDGDAYVLNHIVSNPSGSFKKGDSLEGMKMSKIIEKILCGENKWGEFVWKSEMFDVLSGQMEISAESACPTIVEEFEAAGEDEFYENIITDGRYELYAVCPTVDKDNEDVYKYDCLVKCLDSDYGSNQQTTNPTINGVPETIYWTYDSDKKNIRFGGSAFTTNMTVVLIRRF